MYSIGCSKYIYEIHVHTNMKSIPIHLMLVMNAYTLVNNLHIHINLTHAYTYKHSLIHINSIHAYTPTTPHAHTYKLAACRHTYTYSHILGMMTSQPLAANILSPQCVPNCVVLLMCVSFNIYSWPPGGSMFFLNTMVTTLTANPFSVGHFGISALRCFQVTATFRRFAWLSNGRRASSKLWTLVKVRWT